MHKGAGFQDNQDVLQERIDMVLFKRGATKFRKHRLVYYPNSPAHVSFILACGYLILPHHELATSGTAASTSETF